MKPNLDVTSESNEVNRVMNLSAEELLMEPPKTLDRLIDILRRWYHNQDSGQKMTAEVPKLNLVELGLEKPLVIKRRTGL
jgi:hypothetical protein